MKTDTGFSIIVIMTFVTLVIILATLIRVADNQKQLFHLNKMIEQNNLMLKSGKIK